MSAFWNRILGNQSETRIGDKKLSMELDYIITTQSNNQCFPFLKSFGIQCTIGPKLDILYVQQWDIAPLCENYTKFYFDAKHLKKEWIRGDEIFGALSFFFQKMPVWLILDAIIF